MPTPLLIGVDVGTTRLKVGVFDAAGVARAVAGRDCAPEYRPDGRVEQDAEGWVRAFEVCLEQCLARVDRSAVRALAVSSQAQTYALVNEAGRALGPAVSWLDATGDAEAVAADMDTRDYYAHAGFRAPMPFVTAAKLRSRSERPDAWRGAKSFLFPAGYLIRRLTGRNAASRNLAAMCGLYSMRRADWRPEAVAAARVPEALLPPLFDMGEAVGPVTPDVAERWGLGDVVVAAGANDQTAAALGAGLHAPGQVALGIGTAMVAYEVIEADAPALEWHPLRGPYPGGYHYQLGLTSTACAVLEWARRRLAPGMSWETFHEEALAAPPGAEGLRMGIDFAGVDTGGGALTGLGLGHERAHIFRAALEAVACAARGHLERLGAAGAVLASGGGTRDDGFMRLLAEVVGRPVERVAQPEAGLWGSAIMAGHAAGLFPDMLETARDLHRPGRRFVPTGEFGEVYDQVYRDTQALMGADVP